MHIVEQLCSALPSQLKVIDNCHAGKVIKQSSDVDPLDTDRFASASDYSKGDNVMPAKAQLQSIIGRDKQRVGVRANSLQSIRQMKRL